MNELARNVVPLNADISGAATDEHLISMWLSGRPKTTQRAYTSDIARFRKYVAKPIRSLTAADIIGYAESLGKLALASQHRLLSSVKSLMSYAHRLGYVSLDPAAALRMPKPQSDRASKILSREIVLAIIDSIPPGRDRLICETLYLCGLRESELIGLKLGDVRLNGSCWALSIMGKGGIARYIAIPLDLATALREHGNSPFPDRPIFRSTKGNRLSASDIYRLVVKAGKTVGHHITPHSFRHANASHALDAGAPLHVVRDTLGHSSLATTSVYVHSKPTESSALFITLSLKPDIETE